MDMRRLNKLLHNQAGATAVEYAILVSLIAGVIAAIVGVLGGQMIDLYTRVKWW
jgi:Flp pilus assembly pilin Flp